MEIGGLNFEKLAEPIAMLPGYHAIVCAAAWAHTVASHACDARLCNCQDHRLCMAERGMLTTSLSLAVVPRRHCRRYHTEKDYPADPLLHACIVCASVSCPDVALTAYKPEVCFFRAFVSCVLLVSGRAQTRFLLNSPLFRDGRLLKSGLG